MPKTTIKTDEYEVTTDDPRNAVRVIKALEERDERWKQEMMEKLEAVFRR